MLMVHDRPYFLGFRILSQMMHGICARFKINLIGKSIEVFRGSIEKRGGKTL
jgi:hypothetical protein